MADPRVSESSGFAFQNKSTYLFVPSSFGADKTTVNDDTNTPGSYFRLGGYSDLENRTPVLTAAEKSAFYPRQHITDETAGGADTVVTHAAGKAPTDSGIMLACNGRILVRSAEKIYVHSTDDAHLETDKNLTVKTGGSASVNATGPINIHSSDAVSIKSGTGKHINIIAAGGTGNLEIAARKSTTTINGKSYEKVTKDSYKYMQANSYSYMLGGSVGVTLGGKFSYWLGVSLTIKTSIDMTISASISISLGLVSIGFTASSITISDFSHKLVLFESASVAAEAKQKFAESLVAAIKSEDWGVQSTLALTVVDTVGVTSSAGGPNASMHALEVKI